MPNYSGKWTPSQVLQARGQDLWPINGPFFYVDDVFSTYLWTGDSGTQSISNGIDLDGEGGLVWIKGRTSAYDNGLYDTARGATKEIYSNKTDSEQTNSDTVTSFNSDGFSIGADPLVNTNLEDYVSWSFRKQAGFFDVVTYTGDGTSSRQISHNLGSSPGVIIVKKTNSSIDSYWMVYHRDSPENTATTPNQTKNLVLQSTAAIANNNCFGAHSTQTDSYFTLGTANLAHVNGSGNTYVAYVFAHDDQRFGDNQNESIIKCGSYTGDGGAGTTEIDLGFEPQWILVKATSAADNWFIIDNMRGWATESNTSNDAYLLPNANNAEATGGFLDITATGFKTTLFSNVNVSGRTYAYVAIRRPMKTPESGTDVFSPFEYTGTGSGATTTLSTGFPVDMYLGSETQFNGDRMAFDRLRGNSARLKPNSNDAEDTQSITWFDLSDTFKVTGILNNSGRYGGWAFKRATGFFDVVAYTGNGTAGRTVAHNLGVAPEMMIVKVRSIVEPWVVYHTGLNGGVTPQNYHIRLTNGVEAADSDIWNDTATTSSVFTTGGNDKVNANTQTYIAYLFATLAGISKVGSYTGTAADLDVDCGFSAGARFILIKRTDSSGDWYVYDSSRGIVTGNDPYLLLNSTAAEVTGTDYIDPLSSGFTVTSSAPAGLNASGGTYIFLAIA